MTAEEKLAHLRLSILQLSELLGSVTETYPQRDILRTPYYEYKRWFQTHGQELMTAIGYKLAGKVSEPCARMGPVAPTHQPGMARTSRVLPTPDGLIITMDGTKDYCI